MFGLENRNVLWTGDLQRLLVSIFRAIKVAKGKGIDEMSELITDEICAEFGGQRLMLPAAFVFIDAEKSLRGNSRRKISNDKDAEYIRKRAEVVLSVVAEAKAQCEEQ